MNTSSNYSAILSEVRNRCRPLLDRPVYRVDISTADNAIRLAMADGADKVFRAFLEAMEEASGVALEVREVEDVEPEPTKPSLSADEYLRNVQQAPGPQAP